VATPGAAAEAEEGESAALPARLRVLVTDDSRLNRQLLSHALKFISPAWDVTEATSAEEALALVRSARADGRFELILMDEQFDPAIGSGALPMRGSEAVERIREHEGSAGAPRAVIIRCTGYATNVSAAVEHLLESGSDAVWSKPFPNYRNGEMQAALVNALSGRSLLPVPEERPATYRVSPSYRLSPSSKLYT
jgi:CheY-like chemotaxis protein